MRSPVTEKRIVLATFGSPGDLRPFLAIGAELRRRGHRATIATSEGYRELVTAAGLDFAPVRPDRVPNQQDPDFFARLIRDRRPPGEIFRQMFLPALRDSLEDTLRVAAGADAIVSHTLAVTARLAAEHYGLAWISSVMQPMGYLSIHEPPLIGPVWVAAALRWAGPAPTRGVFTLARSVANNWTREWRGLRRDLGLPATASNPLWEGQHAPQRSLGLFPRLLGTPQADWPPQARITGFPFYAGEHDSLSVPLSQFLDDGHPPLVFTLGTTAVNDPGSFYDVSLDAARVLRRRAVLIVGPGNSGRFRAADDVCVVDYAPHRLLFPRALAIVHQGGIGTLSEALRTGKPMLIMPYAHDQADNAWRATRLGLARTVSRRHYRRSRVAREIERLLDTPNLPAALDAARVDVNKECGAETAAAAIEAAI
jgi:UDP:flavonoid glycosyltransferase YjiC (YdhE family)